MVASKGVNTWLVAPLVNSDIDWRGDFPAGDVRAASAGYTHLGLSWGDRAFFLDTPQWSDVGPRTVVAVLAGGGASPLHISHFIRPAPGPNWRVLMVSHAQYRAIAAAVRAERAPGAAIAGYGADDVFYPARDAYAPWRMCNSWLGGLLRAVGVRVVAWTPLAGGVMTWIAPPPQSPPSPPHQ